MKRLSNRSPRVRLASALALTLTAAIPMVVTAPHASASSAGQITIGGKCLEDVNSATAAGTAIDLAACGSGSNQSFTFAADGTITVLGQCLEIAGGSNATGALLQINTCSGGAAQKFRLLPDSTLYSAKSGKCLLVQGGAITDAARIGLASCDPSQSLQQFGSSAAPSAPYSLSTTAFADGGFSGNDSPSLPFTDQNGQFYYQNSNSQYGTTGHVWEFYSGSNMGTATRAAISDSANPANSADSNADTVWRCANSPTGLNASTVPGGYVYGNYCDLIGVWVDPDTGWWYGLVHNEFTMAPFADSAHYDAIDYAVSKDHGATWTITDHAITSPYTTVRANGQRWTMASDGSVKVGSQCVDITGGGTTAGTAVGRYSCNGQANQHWTVTNGTLVNPASNLCLTASSTASGATFTIAACAGTAAQKFTAPAAGATGQVKLTGNTALCVDGSGSLVLNTCNDPSKDGRIQFPNQTYYWGDGDPRLFVDYRSGYFYVFYMSRLVDQNGGWGAFEEHVARAPLSGKMAASSWTKWYNGSWSTAGVGGAESDLIPADGGGSGYVASADGYSPSSAGSVSSQVAAGSAPPSSQLSVMNVSWNAYLNKYIGTPENEFTSNGAPQHFYASDDLATQKWTDLGPVGGAQSSWYRWLLDPVNKTNSTILGKQFSLYCNVSCPNSSGGGHMEVTITPTASGSLPASPVAAGSAYQISAGSGQYLFQSGSSLTTTGTSGTSAAQLWSFTATGDGFYTIKNSSSGQVLGVDPTTDAGRAWGSGVRLGPLGTSPTVGQQWSIQTIVTSPATSGSSTPTGAYRLVNRYSDLALSLAGGTSPVATSPQRSWDNPGTGGDIRSTAAQTLTFVPGPSTSLNGTHVLSTGGKSLDDPNSSTSGGTQLITWSANGGANQSWTFTQQADGSYTIANAYSNLCADDNGGFTTAGTAVIQWTCTGGANQHWTVAKQADGTYKITNVHTNLLMTTAGTGDGALVTQQPDTNSTLQLWTIS